MVDMSVNVIARVIGVALGLVLGAATPATWAGLPTLAAPAEEPRAAPTVVPLDELGRGTPRGTVTGFIQATLAHDYRRAARYLDLSGIPPVSVAEQGPVMAHKLRVVLDNARIDFGAIADEPEGLREPGM